MTNLLALYLSIMSTVATLACGGEVSDSCGNSWVDSELEQCDDGNEVSGDGCSSTCQVESIPTNE